MDGSIRTQSATGARSRSSSSRSWARAAPRGRPPPLPPTGLLGEHRPSSNAISPSPDRAPTPPAAARPPRPGRMLRPPEFEEEGERCRRRGPARPRRARGAGWRRRARRTRPARGVARGRARRRRGPRRPRGSARAAGARRGRPRAVGGGARGVGAASSRAARPVRVRRGRPAGIRSATAARINGCRNRSPVVLEHVRGDELGRRDPRGLLRPRRARRDLRLRAVAEHRHRRRELGAAAPRPESRSATRRASDGSLALRPSEPSLVASSSRTSRALPAGGGGVDGADEGRVGAHGEGGDGGLGWGQGGGGARASWPRRRSCRGSCGPRRAAAGAGDQHDDRELLHAPREVGEEAQARLRRPLGVVDGQQQRLLGGEVVGQPVRPCRAAKRGRRGPRGWR